MRLAELNAIPLAAAREAFERCCGAKAWVEGMCTARPFADLEALHAVAERVARPLGRPDRLEAFAHHPRIGDAAALREKFAATRAWAGEEQSGAADAADEVMEALVAGNRAYESRFGYIFIVYATGKSAAEMLALLQARIDNTPERELEIAWEEQMKITRLRLDKLVEDR
jgi:2-oxo-4-hydroxy-4-carboxy-5-ureidoimidazoline decarboxylase